MQINHQGSENLRGISEHGVMVYMQLFSWPQIAVIFMHLVNHCCRSLVLIFCFKAPGQNLNELEPKNKTTNLRHLSFDYVGGGILLEGAFML